MENEETPINASADPHGVRAVLGRVLLTLEEHVLWRVEDALRALFGVLRRPLDSVVWVLQRWLIWPLQDRFASLGGPARTLFAGGGLALFAALCVGAYAVIASGGSDEGAEPPVAAVSEPPLELSAAAAGREPAETLHGAAPVFKPKETERTQPDAAKQAPAAPPPAEQDSSSAATDTISSSPSAPSSSTASTSTASVDGPPAGPKALAVARRFADAFVVYETGGEKGAVRGAFATTASEQLARSLLRRPPRLPANVEVPKAKVLNVVAGPSHGGVYTVSVSLLRVGVSSELRLDMEKLPKDGWRVTNVLG
jgi:hypothetical protein